MTHSLVLALAYASVCALWWGVHRLVPLWRDPERPRFPHPWKEVAIALLAVVGVVLLGQLWVRGIRFPARGAWIPLVESLNQFLIFSPILAVPCLRRQGWASAWVQRPALGARLALGLGLAILAVSLYSALERGAPDWGETMRGVFTPARAHLAVQVLLEDLAIAILFVRVSAATGPRVAILAVAALFAAAHIPSMLARGATIQEVAGLLRDLGLGVLVLGTAWRSADVAWVWPVHYSLDMTQFLSRPN
ncbi:MAG: hypothetical protein L0323_20835 [Planctomycetes bacterium]|nr:hypothetical protein [Planctomycetota bacterium]